MARDTVQQVALLLVVIVFFAYVGAALRRSQDREFAAMVDDETAEAELAAAVNECWICMGPCEAPEDDVDEDDVVYDLP